METPLKPAPRRARDPYERENQLIALAVDRVEQRIRDGQASSAELLYFLKLASPNAVLERRVLELQAELLEAKRDSLRAEQTSGDLYKEALAAFGGYLPNKDDGDIVDGEFRDIR